MEQTRKVIEDLMWNDVFSSDIISTTIEFVIVLAVLHIASILVIPKATKIWTYSVKAMIYAILVIMLLIYIGKHGTSINIFTGFTFLFSSIEVIDNLGLALEETFGTNILFRKRKKKDFESEESDFNNYMCLLFSLQTSLTPGRVKKDTKKYVSQIMDIYNNNHFHFCKIENIISNGNGNPIRDSFYNIMKSCVFHEINSYNIKSDKKHPTSSLSFKKHECDELRDCLQTAIKLQNIYYQKMTELQCTMENSENLK